MIVKKVPKWAGFRILECTCPVCKAELEALECELRVVHSCVYVSAMDRSMTNVMKYYAESCPICGACYEIEFKHTDRYGTEKPENPYKVQIMHMDLLEPRQKELLMDYLAKQQKYTFTYPDNIKEMFKA